jgi:hypothetical protein
MHKLQVFIFLNKLKNKTPIKRDSILLAIATGNKNDGEVFNP